MSLVRRWGLPALVLCLSALAPSAGALRAADEAPAALDGKAVDALVHKTLREVINEGADMYNAKGKYENQERDYLGCYHFYQGALLVTRPLLGNHPELQKAIDDGLESARNTPRSEMRAFVLREVIDKIRDAVNPNPPPKEWTAKGKIVSTEKGKLTVSVEGKDKAFTVPETAKVTIDDKDGKLEDLKKDSDVTITSKGDAVTKVEAKSPAAPPPPKETTATGKVVSAEKGKLTATVEGKEKTFTVPETAKVTIDDKDGKLEDLKKDSAVTVTSKGDAVTKVEAKSPTSPPPPKETTAKGKVVSAEKGKLTASVEGKDKAFTVPETAKVTIDGKDGKLEDIKKDSEVTVTSKGDEVTKVEAKGPGAPPPQTLWDRLGGEANVAKVVDDFVNTAGKDPKVNFFRDPTATPSKEDVAALKKKLVEFISAATGGPLNYDGKDMKVAHKGMKITDDEFDATVADLKAALEKNGAKADDVKAVLSAVEGTRKDIVEVKKPEDKDKPKPPEDKDKPKNPDDKDKPKPPADKDKTANAATVSGKVTYKGKPVTVGVIVLTSADGRFIVVDLTADGTYKVEDLKPGDYSLAVDTTPKDPTKPNPAAVQIPKKYADSATSGLKVEVKKGEQTLDLDLKD